MIITLESILDRYGPKSSVPRLIAIASMDLGERSEAAKRVIEKRERRVYLVAMGFTFQEACLILNSSKV